MQLFVRCGAPTGTVVVECLAQDRVWNVKELLLSKAPQLGKPESLCLLYAGRQLRDDEHVGSYQVTACSTLQVSGRLRGGGGDGGSTGAESRSCYLEMYKGKKKDKVNPIEELLARWTRCHLSGEPLARPVVIDELGNLYNKEAMLHALITKTLPSSLSHITALKHVVELQLESAAGTSSRGTVAAAASFQPSNDAEFCCPVTGTPFNGRFKFVVLKATGQVFAERAIREAPSVVEDLVGRKTSEEDWLVVNPTGDALAAAQAHVTARLAVERERKAAKASKSRDKFCVKAPAVNGTAVTVAAALRASDGTTCAVPSTASNMKRPLAPLAPASGHAPLVAVATAASAVLHESGASSKRYRASDHVPLGATKSVYASLFSSSQTHTVKETYCCRSTSAHGMKMG